MKTSNRLLSATLLAILALPVLVVAYNRIGGAAPGTRPAPERTPVAELSTLSGFTAIEVEGDFTLEIIGSTEFSVTYDPARDDRGNFNARVENGTLQLRGFGNRTEAGRSLVRIAVPALESLTVSYTPELLVSGLNGAELDATIVAIGDVTFANNNVELLELEGHGIERMNLDGNEFTTSEVRLSGFTLVTTR